MFTLLLICQNLPKIINNAQQAERSPRVSSRTGLTLETSWRVHGLNISDPIKLRFSAQVYGERMVQCTVSLGIRCHTVWSTPKALKAR